MDGIILFLAGALASWLITHAYHRRSSVTPPDWAKDLVKSLPRRQPTDKQLRILFQRHLDSGKVEIDPILGRVACPECGASAKRFRREHFGDDRVDVVVATCPQCGWSDHAEV